MKKVLTGKMKKCSILQVANNNGENRKTKSQMHLSLTQCHQLVSKKDIDNRLRM